MHDSEANFNPSEVLCGQEACWLLLETVWSVFSVILTCLLARTIKGRSGSEARSSCKCVFARGKSCGLEESTTNTSISALDMYFCQYGRRTSLPPTDRENTIMNWQWFFYVPWSGSHVTSDSLSRNSMCRSPLLMETALKPCVGCTSCSRLPVAQQWSRLVLPAPFRPSTSTCVPAWFTGLVCRTHSPVHTTFFIHAPGLRPYSMFVYEAIYLTIKVVLLSLKNIFYIKFN